MSIKRFGIDPDNKLGLSKDDVFSCPISDFGVQGMVKLEQLIKLIDGWSASSQKADEPAWFSEEGRKCEILRTAGGGWQKGRFRFRLEFIPDNPEAFEQKTVENDARSESPLDDLRSNLEI